MSVKKRRVIIYMNDEEFQEYNSLVNQDHFHPDSQTTRAMGAYAHDMLMGWVRYRAYMKDMYGVDLMHIEDIYERCKDPDMAADMAHTD